MWKSTPPGKYLPGHCPLAGDIDETKGSLAALHSVTNILQGRLEKLVLLGRFLARKFPPRKSMEFDSYRQP